jgi:hypothetical protein
LTKAPPQAESAAVCPKCDGTKWVRYDSDHKTICSACCQHEGGWWRLGRWHSHPGKLCCRTGCGKVVDPIYFARENRAALVDVTAPDYQAAIDEVKLKPVEGAEWKHMRVVTFIAYPVGMICTEIP